MDRAELIEVLGVSDSPTTGELRLARRRAARRLHPDTAGDRAAEAMAREMSEVNEACDRWIDEIRTTRDAPTVSMPASFVQQPRATTTPPPASSGASATSVTSAGGLQPVYALATIALMVVIMGVIVFVAGPSVASIAIGALFGAAGGAIYLLILRGLVGTGR
jgi:hypothetical protein